MIQEVVERASKKGSSPTRRLRELGVYTMPDGREFIASTLYSDGCCLYTTRSWETYRNSEFWVDKSGQLLRMGRPTAWSILDLKDTGRTTRYPTPIIT